MRGVPIVVDLQPGGRTMEKSAVSVQDVEKELQASQDVEPQRVTLGVGNPPPEALHGRFPIKGENFDGVSDLYLLPYRNHFIKVRITRKRTFTTESEPLVKKLLTALGSMIIT